LKEFSEAATVNANIAACKLTILDLRRGVGFRGNVLLVMVSAMLLILAYQMIGCLLAVGPRDLGGGHGLPGVVSGGRGSWSAGKARQAAPHFLASRTRVAPCFPPGGRPNRRAVRYGATRDPEEGVPFGTEGAFGIMRLRFVLQYRYKRQWKLGINRCAHHHSY
jgi:hypothetical protein